MTLKKFLGGNKLKADQIYYDDVTSLLDAMWPIGRGFIDFTNTDYSDYLGFTWERELVGMSPIGLDTTQTEFNTIGKTGGSKTNSHTHSFSHTHSVPGVSHSHNLGDNGYAKLNLASSGSVLYAKMNINTSFAENYYAKINGNRTAVSNDTTSGVILLGGRTEASTPGGATTNSQSTTTTGGPSDTNNMSPYKVVAYWKRVA